jgi:hypothetical protein
MKEVLSTKEIEDGIFEVIVPAGEDIPPGYLLTLSQEGYSLCEEQSDIEWDKAPGVNYVDIYSFKKRNSVFRQNSTDEAAEDNVVNKMTKLTKKDIYFIETALNAYWVENMMKVTSKTAGDVEKDQAKTSVMRATEIMKKISDTHFNWEDYLEE